MRALILVAAATPFMISCSGPAVGPSSQEARTAVLTTISEALGVPMEAVGADGFAVDVNNCKVVGQVSTCEAQFQSPDGSKATVPDIEFSRAADRWTVTLDQLRTAIPQWLPEDLVPQEYDPTLAEEGTDEL